jgi:glycosyltransferase involved in cell wall biosynthesis
MPALYRAADVFLHMAQEESFGNVYLEAMASGLPVVAHDSARTRWICGEAAFLVDTADAAAVAAAIAAAAREGGAPDGAPRPATADDATPASERVPERVAARIARAAEFSWVKVGAMYRDFLREVVGAPP